ncbi:MAG: polyprenyl synthetase family protein [Chloroflexota bacterium]|nr:polyprenyl synthetase family protein [Chloroflexota bacterium]
MPESPGELPFAALLDAVESRKRMLQDYLMQERFVERFRPAHIRQAVYSYLRNGGKSLRPAVAMLACGALGGDERRALPVAAAIEIYHTWTLVHDDVIDRDDTRRGLPTIHREFARRAVEEFGWRATDAEHYGRTIAMLTGDVQQSWSWSLLFDAHLERGVSAEVLLHLAQELASRVTPLLVEGETLDVQYAGRATQLDEAQIIDMLWKKTGVLYEFAGRAGAAIALDDADAGRPEAKNIARFCRLCGTAFQIQDDILGVVGDASQLGKPVGSDIREGKSTLLTLKALERADARQRELIERALGDAAASADDVKALSTLFRELGVIGYAQDISHRFVNEALEHLSALPDSNYRALLAQWAQYLIERRL